MLNDNGVVDEETPVTTVEIEAMIRVMLRYQHVLSSALRIGLRAEHFGNDAAELKFYFLFYAMHQLFERHKTITKHMLLTELNAWHTAGALHLAAGEFEAIAATDGFIAEAFDTPKDDSHAGDAERQYGQDILKRFINARMIKTEVQDVVRSTTDAAPVNMPTKLEQITKKAQAVRFIGQSIVSAALMPEFGAHIELPPPPVPTGVGWIDNFIGGFRAGDLIGVLGPYGGGKSTMMATLAVRQAEHFYNSGQNKLSVFICYEDDAKRMGGLFWSAAARIRRNLFQDNANFWADFTTPETIMEYERQLPENRNGEIIISEADRYRAAKVWLDQNFVLLDFSANSEHGGRGTGGVAEIVATLTALCEERNMQIGFVAVDYAGLMLNRELSQNKSTKNQEQIWRQMQQLPDDLRTMVAAPFNATVLLAHQLAGGDIKKIPPYKHVTHLDAQGSKAFAENLHACMCLNTRDQFTNVSTINWSKIRYCVPEKYHGLVKMDPVIVDVRLVDDEYVICPTSKRIIRRGDVTPLSPDDAAVAARTSSNHFTPVDSFSDDLNF